MKFEYEEFRKMVQFKKGVITSKVFADSIGISISNLSRAENNKTITVETYLRICSALELDVLDYINFNED